MGKNSAVLRLCSSILTECMYLFSACQIVLNACTKLGNISTKPQVGKSACIVLAKERHSKGERVPFSALS